MIFKIYNKRLHLPKSTISLIVLVCVAVFLCRCTKQVPGPKGDTGAAGGNGNAKHSTTVVFNHPASAWAPSEDNWETVIFVPEITEQVLSGGKVKVYVQINDLWWPLPHEASETFTQFTLRNGFIKLFCERLHGNTVKPVSANYRVTIVN